MNISDRQGKSNNDPPVWLSVRSVAERMDCCERIVRTLIEVKHIPAIKWRGRWRILETDLIKYMENPQ